MINEIIQFEEGELDFVETVKLFSALIKSGQIMGLQGNYQRLGALMIIDGLLENDGSINWDKMEDISEELEWLSS